MKTDPRIGKMTEAELQESVRLMCRHLGLYHYHPRDSRRSEPGWPDSTIIGPHRIIYRELKSEWGRLSPEQTRVGYLLQAAGQNWQVWRPSDWLSGQVAKELSDLAAHQGQLFDA